MPASKSIFLSYADEDVGTADSLRTILTDMFREEVWFRDFDLNGGDLIATVLAEAVSTAKWFIILVSASSLQRSWLRVEADLATFRSIEDLNFRIVIIRLDASPVPNYLDIALRTQFYVDLCGIGDKQSEFIRIAAYIKQTSDLITHKQVYVDRGELADQFSLRIRSNSIVFLVGWAGIGKTAFVQNSVVLKLNKNPLSVNVTRGHSADRLARDIIREAHALQPVGPNTLSDTELVAQALDALATRSERFFLFLDDCQEALDPSNRLLPYFESFLDLFSKSGIRTHVIVATSRNPSLPASISTYADILVVPRLANPYIRESILLWADHDSLVSETRAPLELDHLSELVKLTGGTPLAAKMIASSLRVRTASQLLAPLQRKRFHLSLADYIIRASDTDTEVISELDRLVLQILATIREPMLTEDLLAITEITKNYSLDDVHEARTRLTDLFLIEQVGEFMRLHEIIQTYFRDQLEHHDSASRRMDITRDFGNYAYNKTLLLNRKLSTLWDQDGTHLSDATLSTSNEVFRYAVPAYRLLTAFGDTRARDLPIKVRGNLRELVFYFYQDERDYAKCVEYAKQWLDLYPTDRQIQLYLARSYRQLRGEENLAKAARIISDLQLTNPSPSFETQLLREKGRISEYSNKPGDAKSYYRKGVAVDDVSAYPEIHADLARLLLREADSLPDWAPAKQDKIEEALRVLERVRGRSAKFDRYHLELYAEVLYQAHQEETALPLLEEALEDRPNDGMLNFRLAEILKRQHEYDRAEHHALVAVQNHTPNGLITLADIACDRAQHFNEVGDIPAANRQLRMALQRISRYTPSLSHEREISDTITARIHRFLGEWQAASDLMLRYAVSKNPYTIYEQCHVHLWQATEAVKRKAYDAAMDFVHLASALILDYKGPPSSQLNDLLGKAYAFEDHINDLKFAD